MPTRDIASDLAVEVAFSASISSDTDTLGVAIDTAEFDGGVLFFMAVTAYTDGTYVLSLQESDTSGGTYTDVAANKLIEPNGTITLSALTVAGDKLQRIGAFSTKQFLKAKITSTSTTSGADLDVKVVKKAELKPAAL